MTTKTKLETKNKFTNENYTYDYTIETESVSVNMQNNWTSEDRTDKTYLIIKTVSGDVIVINQHNNEILVNNTVIKGKKQ